MNLDLALGLLASLVGLPALWAAVVDILKYYGLITDGSAGAWNAGFNLFSLVAMLVVVNFFPDLNVAGWDAKFMEIAKLLGLAMSFVAQIFVSKGFHKIYAKAFPALSFSKKKAMLR